MHFGCFVKAWWLSSEPTSWDLFRSRSGNIQEQRLRKPGTHGGPLTNRFLSRVVFLSHHSGNLNGSELKESPHMVTGVQDEIADCSPGTSLGKQKKARSTSQPQFCSENTAVKSKEDQILLAFQQFATNSNSANFNNKINRVLKMLKSLTTTMSTFDGKSEKNWNDWRSLPNKFETSQSTDKRRQ